MSSTITLGGIPIEVAGDFPKKGQTAPDFLLVGNDLADVALGRFGDKRKILNIFPSIDTPVCAMSVRAFNKRASELPNTAVLCVSADLPFAQKRFCGAEGLNDVVTLSLMRGRGFLKDYGVEIASGPMVGLAARAVIVLDGKNRILHAELVPEIKNEPDYDAAIEALG
ncbi:MAG: thiol peroxidase [Candidatus Accumulibacter sp.]|jgi:thiol peroxidase|nr:thiol peroxidase [Accumulibacter sp.]